MSPGYRVTALAIVWAVMLTVWFTLLFSDMLMDFGGIFLAFIALLMAGASTLAIIGAGSKATTTTTRSTTRRRTSTAKAKAKTKNEQVASIDPLSLLTPDDLEELRAEVKAQLRQRLIDGSEGELTSLDALLADHDQLTRRK